jgi:hypothetical protein
MIQAILKTDLLDKSYIKTLSVNRIQESVNRIMHRHAGGCSFAEEIN